jgi:hypothetical protein
MIYQEISNEPLADELQPDLFRRKEREIKAFIKSKQVEHDKVSHKQKTGWNESKKTDGSLSSFCWNDVVDVRSSSSSSPLQFIRSVPSSSSSSVCCCAKVHSCSVSSELYELQNENIQGLYLIKNALCPNQQLYWSKIALESYSTAEHTNLTNLSKLQDSGDPEVGPKSSDLAEIEEDLHNLWERSKKENNNFQCFNKLRWSCLGYHYGK